MLAFPAFFLLFGMQHVIRFLSHFSISFLFFFLSRSFVSVVVGGFLFSIPCFSAICLLKEACLTFFILFFCILHNCTLFLFFFFFLVYERQLSVLSISVSDSSTLFCWTLLQDPYYFLFVVSSYHINTLFSKLSAV